MPATKTHIAFDLGAESGRAVAGRFDGTRLVAEEVHRFPNIPTRVRGTLHWNVLTLLEEIKRGLRAGARAARGQLGGVGIDTWGVDFGLLAGDGSLLANPVHYRDRRTEGVMEKVFAVVPREEIYRLTGIQFFPITTIYQLFSMTLSRSPILAAARTFLMMPDLLHFFITGRCAVELSNASTTQLMNPRTGRWAEEIFARLGLPLEIMPEIIQPGTVLGPLLPEVAEEVGLMASIPVIAPSTHDTGSAVVAVPAESDEGDWAYLSSGTWSILGVELGAPLITEEALAHNFSNEQGTGGTTRFLRDLVGLWMLQECRRAWERRGESASYDLLCAEAEQAPPFAALIDVDDPRLLAPEDMPATIAHLCRETGQTPPASRGAFVRCVFESLALGYRQALQELERVTRRAIRVIHLVGGGARNRLLCQMTADACGRPVLAGPTEATALGNLAVQLIATGELGSLREARALIRASVPLVLFEPRDAEPWDEAADCLARQRQARRAACPPDPGSGG